MADGALVEEWELRLVRNGHDVGGASVEVRSMDGMAVSAAAVRYGLRRALDRLLKVVEEADDGANGDLEGV